MPRIYTRYGIHLISTDEMTAIQALERAHATHSMRPVQVEKPEFEYIRHGTQSLIANLEVATGQVVSPYDGATRTEADFVAHSRLQVYKVPPMLNWIKIWGVR